MVCFVPLGLESSNCKEACGEPLRLKITDNQVMPIPSDVLELRKLALEALLEPTSDKKVALAQWIQAQVATLSIAIDTALQEPAGVPGCPQKPELRSHLDVPKRSPFTSEGLAALLHAVAPLSSTPSIWHWMPSGVLMVCRAASIPTG
jgi:hypothetical protein